MYFLSLFWVLFTHPLLDSSGKMQSNEGGKHFTGRIKESQSFTHNTVKTYNKVTIQFLLFLCFYIYIDYFSMSVLICLTFFFLCTVEVSKVMGDQALWKMLFICLSPSVILPASVMMFTDVSLSPPPPYVVNLSSVLILRPSLSPERALSLSQRDSISSLLLLLSHVKISDLSRCQICISSTSQTLLAQSEPILYRGCADTTVLYATNQCNTQAKHSL